MAIAFTPGFTQGLFSGPAPGKIISTKNLVQSSAISFGDGDGTGGRDTINAAGGLSAFSQHSWVHIFGGVNADKYVYVELNSDTKLEVAAGTFTAASTGTAITLAEFDVIGVLRGLMANGVIFLYAEAAPASASSAEPGLPKVTITKNGGPFVPGAPTNGLNAGDFLDGELRKAIDPATSYQEVWQGVPSETVVINSFMWCNNAAIRSASSSAIRIIGRVGTDPNADMVLEGGTTVTAGVPVNVRSLRIQLKPGVFVA